jgi:hypothetical protein
LQARRVCGGGNLQRTAAAVAPAKKKMIHPVVTKHSTTVFNSQIGIFL